MSPFRRNARRRAERRADPLAATTMRRGALYEMRYVHDAECRRPQGEGCTCIAGPSMEVRPIVDPEEN